MCCRQLLRLFFTAQDPREVFGSIYFGFWADVMHDHQPQIFRLLRPEFLGKRYGCVWAASSSNMMFNTLLQLRYTAQTHALQLTRIGRSKFMLHVVAQLIS